MADERPWTIYLAGEIHTDWRERIVMGSKAAELPVEFSAPVTDHEYSDDCGEVILGAEDNPFWKDHKGAKLNAIRTRTLLQEADLVIVCFSDQYRQWNAAFEAGYAIANDKPLIVIHPPELTHPLKEIDAAAQAVCQHPEQVVKILRYVTDGEL